MKSRWHFVFLLFMYVSCSNTESHKDIKESSLLSKSTAPIPGKKSTTFSIGDNKTCCVPDPNMFLLKPAENTVSQDSVSLIRQLKDLNKEQVKAWTNPIPKKNRYNIELQYQYFKAVGFQKKTDHYSLILLMMAETIEDHYAMGQQNLITVDNNGKYIDGIPVCYLKNLSNSDAEIGSPSGLYQFSTRTHSHFSGDTIKVYQLVSVSEIEDPHSDTDEWDETYETLYIVNPKGKIEMIRKPKKIADERD